MIGRGLVLELRLDLMYIRVWCLIRIEATFTYHSDGIRYDRSL